MADLQKENEFLIEQHELAVQNQIALEQKLMELTITVQENELIEREAKFSC